MRRELTIGGGSRAWPRLAATALALAALIWMVDGRAVWGILAATDPILAGLAVLLVQAQTILSAWRWREIAARLGLPIAPATAIGEYYLAGLLNQLLPGGVPGDVARAVRLRIGDSAWRPGVGESSWRPVVRSIVIERTAGQIALAAVAAAGLAALGGDVWMGSGVDVAIILAVLALAILSVVLLVRHGPAPLGRALADLGPDFRAALFASGAWRTQVGLNLSIVAAYIAAFALAAAATGHPLPVAALITLVPLVLFSMAIPLTVGGWGIREGTAAALWPSIGLEPEAGVAAGALYGLILLAGSLPGLIVLLRPRAGR